MPGGAVNSVPEVIHITQPTLRYASRQTTNHYGEDTSILFMKLSLIGQWRF